MNFFVVFSPDQEKPVVGQAVELTYKSSPFYAFYASLEEAVQSIRNNTVEFPQLYSAAAEYWIASGFTTDKDLLLCLGSAVLCGGTQTITFTPTSLSFFSNGCCFETKSQHIKTKNIQMERYVLSVAYKTEVEPGWQNLVRSYSEVQVVGESNDSLQVEASDDVIAKIKLELPSNIRVEKLIKHQTSQKDAIEYFGSDQPYHLTEEEHNDWIQRLGEPS